MAVELRPLGVGEKLDAAFSLYRRNFGTLLGIVAMIIIPFQLASVYLASLADRDSVGSVLFIGLISVVVGFIGNVFATGSVTKAIVDDYLGETPNWQDSLRFGWTKVGPLVVGSILYGLGLLFGFVLFIIPGVFLWVTWAMWVPAVIVEDRGGKVALGRSNALAKGRRWPVFGFLIVVYLIVSIIDLIAGSVLFAFVSAGSAADTVINVAVALLVAPFVAAATVVLYFDQRVRVEAFDVELLASQISGTPVPKGFGSLDGETPPASPPPFPPSDQG
ncbi:MAG: glycerophosphoryl diester phosphodiesterase membrane domain-containing protein [Acidimicrobiia bacterium]|nr:MAG: glycerophosphoryl diester phosphodiesterase membrane domain-containing protein [Acidimicrobiia bacterium]